VGVTQHMGATVSPCSGMRGAGVLSCAPFPDIPGSCSCCPPLPLPCCPDPAAGPEPPTASSIFREGLGPRPPGAQWRSVFLHSRALHSCWESFACRGASASSPSFWAGPGSVAPQPIAATLCALELGFPDGQDGHRLCWTS